MTLSRPLARRLAAVVAVAPLAMAAACAGDDALDSDGGDAGAGAEGGGGEVVVAGQNFTEMLIMAQIYKGVLEAGGYDVTLQLVESRDVYTPEMQKGRVDVSADYLSSMTEFLNAQENGPDAEPVASNDADATLEELRKLAEPTGIEPLEPAAAQDANGFAVTKEFAEANDLTTLSDLAALGEPVTLAAAEDCSERDECKVGLEETYGMEISRVEPLGFGTQGTKDALVEGEVVLGQIGTTDPSIEALDLVMLEDDKQLQNAENLVPMVNSDFLDANPEVAGILNEMSSELTTANLAVMIGQVDVERQLPEDVAHEYLVETGLMAD
ncbi:MAG TPA: ABC transporter substrate-binding protein [Nocardioides sp.]|uniref:ABC transporter substrate-binding protein n=1 Tax=Nocardioides sp. TaxID=35761 RepID=UPI002D7F1C12|nr:ABC transporter substrate-binding protein [Nocardioides sp.]HET6652571.1 ABC transporter substrate-binding protein [Nocardioides sp.]